MNKLKTVFFLVITGMALFLSAGRASAQSITVLDFYVLDRFPYSALEGCVEPVGDDIFSSERLGLQRSTRRLLYGMIHENTDFPMPQLKEPESLAMDQENVFRYYVASENPGDFFDQALLGEAAEELRVDKLVVGFVNKLDVKGKGTPGENVKMKVSFLVYDKATGTFTFAKSYEEDTTTVTGYPDLAGLPAFMGRVPEDIKILASCEIGRVFISAAEKFIDDYTGTSVGTYLDGEFIETPAAAVAAAAGQKKPPIGSSTPQRPSSQPLPGEQEGGPKTSADCIDRGQSAVITVPGARKGLVVYSCRGKGISFDSPESVSDPIVSSKKGLSALSAGDIDGDGVDELIVSTFEPGERVRIFRPDNRRINAAAPAYELVHTIAEADVGVYAAPGDFNGDGRDEIAVSAAYGLDKTTIYAFNDGNFDLENPLLVFREVIGKSGNGTTVAAGDFDGDGRDELVVGSDGAGEIVKVYSMAGGGKSRPALLADLGNIFGALSTSVSVAAGDFNADGKDELAVSTMNHGVKVKVLAFRDGKFDVDNPVADIRTEEQGDEQGARVFAGDLNGDRIDDLAVSSIGGSGEFWVFQYRRGGFDLANPYIYVPGLDSSGMGLIVGIGYFD